MLSLETAERLIQDYDLKKINAKLESFLLRSRDIDLYEFRTQIMRCRPLKQHDFFDLLELLGLQRKGIVWKESLQLIPSLNEKERILVACVKQDSKRV